jgi:REase_DpnII-MboI/Uncharacterized protein conserved in bacteria (DUF2321)
MTTHELERDVMLVCWNGHVITDLLRARPDLRLSRCDRCGAPTLHRCPTCGEELPGANRVHGLEPVGTRPVPRSCPRCGVEFPWAGRVTAVATDPLGKLERLLRRLPLVARQLQSRFRGRPPFAVRDDRDLEDLVRGLLPLHFDDIRPVSRTPKYEPATRMDFVLAPEGLVVAAHLAPMGVAEDDVVNWLTADVAHYEERRPPDRLVFFVYDPERRLPNPERLEAQWTRGDGQVGVTCVIAS